MLTYFCISLLCHEDTVVYFDKNNIKYFNADVRYGYIYRAWRVGRFYVIQAEATTITASILQMGDIRFIPLESVSFINATGFNDIKISDDQYSTIRRISSK